MERKDPKICDSNEDCMNAWDENCLGKEFKGAEAITISSGEARGDYYLERNQESVPLFFSREDGLGFIRWWRGENGNVGEWLISGTRNGALVIIYRIIGNRSSVPELGWKDHSDKAVNIKVTPSEKQGFQKVALITALALVLLLIASVLICVLLKRKKKQRTVIKDEDNPVYGMYYFDDGRHIDEGRSEVINDNEGYVS